MTIVNIHEAKTHLSRLITRAREGEEIFIAKRNVPLVKLQVSPPESGKRKLGLWPDLIETMENGALDPVEDYDSDIFPSNPTGT